MRSRLILLSLVAAAGVAAVPAHASAQRIVICETCPRRVIYSSRGDDYFYSDRMREQALERAAHQRELALERAERSREQALERAARLREQSFERSQRSREQALERAQRDRELARERAERERERALDRSIQRSIDQAVRDAQRRIRPMTWEFSPAYSRVYIPPRPPTYRRIW